MISQSYHELSNNIHHRTTGQGLDMQRWMDHNDHAATQQSVGETGLGTATELRKQWCARLRVDGACQGPVLVRRGEEEDVALVRCCRCNRDMLFGLARRRAKAPLLDLTAGIDVEAAARAPGAVSNESWVRAQTGGRTLGPARRSSALWSCRAGRAGACGTAARAHHLWTQRRQSRYTRRARRRKCRARRRCRSSASRQRARSLLPRRCSPARPWGPWSTRCRRCSPWTCSPPTPSRAAGPQR